MKSFLFAFLVLCFGSSNAQVTFYKDWHYEGASVGYGEGEVNELGPENTSFWGKALGIGCTSVCNDQISSLKLSPGWAITVYEDKDYKGESRTFYSDVYYIGDDFNDKVSSFKVFRSSLPREEDNSSVKDRVVYFKSNYSGEVFLYYYSYVPVPGKSYDFCKVRKYLGYLKNGDRIPMHFKANEEVNYGVYTKNECDIKFVKNSGFIGISNLPEFEIVIAP
jgi:hypothetical protein